MGTLPPHQKHRRQGSLYWETDDTLKDRIGLRLQTDLKRACKQYARQERRSLSNWIVDRLYEAVARREAHHKKSA